MRSAVAQRITALPPESLRAQMLGAWMELKHQLREAWGVGSVRLGFVGSMCIAAGSFTPAFLPPMSESHIALRLGVGWMQGGLGRFLATVALMLGVAILVEAWLRVYSVAMRGLLPRATWLLWSAPLLICPPLFSRDAYSYAAQGLIVGRGFNPYTTGPIAVPGQFADHVDSLWMRTPAPYGPVSLQLAHFMVDITGGNAYIAAVSMRIPALIAVAVMAYALPRLAEIIGTNPGQALWLGILNPLVILHLVGGAHNDAMMIGCTVLALLWAARGQLVAASAGIALAAGFKQIAVLALVGVAGLVMRSRHAEGSLPLFVNYGIKSGALAAAGFAVLTHLTGLGWGWITTILTVPASIRSLLSPPTLVGQLVEWGMIGLRMPREWYAYPVMVTQKIGMVVTILVMLWLTLKVAPRKPVAAAGGMLIAFCLGAPVVHPWYMLWGGVIVTAASLGRRWFESAVWVTIFLLGYSVLDAAFSNGLWALGLTTLAVAYWRFRRPRQNSYTPSSVPTMATS